MSVRVYYHLSQYVSHRVAGTNAVSALRKAGVELVDSPQAADVIIVHDEPSVYPSWSTRYAGIKRLVAYCVWEAVVLPEQYRRNLLGFDRVWTCTPFSAQAFQDAGFVNVDVVPHVVPPHAPSDDDVAFMRERIGYRPDVRYFYTIVDSINPRKNFSTLLHVFTSTLGRDPNVRLIVKQYREPWDVGSLPNVVDVSEHLSKGEMQALHEVGDVYISAHHAEAWGLPLSEAMAAGNPVIATGFSGNMFFMNDENSFPVRYHETSVSDAMLRAVPLFTTDMRWGNIDEGHLAYLLRKVSRGRIPAGVSRSARKETQRFSPRSVGMLMKNLLDLLHAPST